VVLAVAQDHRGPAAREAPFAQRWTVDLRQGALHWGDAAAASAYEQLFDFPGDMPRVDPRALMEPTRHSWIGCMNPALGPMPEFGPMGPPFNSIVHRDDHTGVQSGYFVGEEAAPEEPVFVPRTATTWWFSTRTIKIQFRPRYGFHGTWVPGAEPRRG
jgi:carotenoid cleavage dioxygenase-like enzyme